MQVKDISFIECVSHESTKISIKYEISSDIINIFKCDFYRAVMGIKANFSRVYSSRLNYLDISSREINMENISCGDVEMHANKIEIKQSFFKSIRHYKSFDLVDSKTKKKTLLSVKKTLCMDRKLISLLKMEEKHSCRTVKVASKLNAELENMMLHSIGIFLFFAMKTR